ncbi:MAG: hypothetical protein HC817_02775 [Saprospiraceae bacterium]|nr:hypothetical protein [Saprospiraceae bacterium]
MQQFRQYLPECFISLLACAIFLCRFGIETLDITNINWIFRLSFDPATEFIAWQYYRWTDWHFPILGFMEGYNYPMQTGTGMTALIPPLAFLVKIFSPILPTEMQYFGWWLLLCYVLQGVFGVKILRGLAHRNHLTINDLTLFIGACFFLCAPIMWHRSGHIHMICHFSYYGV